MIRLVAVAFVLAVATSAQAMSPAPLHQPDGDHASPPSPPTPTVLRPGQVRKWGCPRCGADGICMLVVPPLARHRAHRRSYEYD